MQLLWFRQSAKETCPAWGEKSKNCVGRNFFAKKCRKPPKKINSLWKESTDSDSDVEYVTSRHTGKYHKEIYLEMLAEEKRVEFQVDGGTSVNIIPAKFVECTEVKTTTKTLQMCNDTALKPKGSCGVIPRNSINEKKVSVELLVVSETLTPLNGARAPQQWGWLPPKRFG